MTSPRHPRHHPRHRNAVPISAQNVFVCIGYLWAVHVHQWGAPLRAVPRKCTAWTAQAFSSDSWSSRQLWHFSSRSVVAKNKHHRGRRAETGGLSSPTARASYPSIRAGSRFSAADASWSRNSPGIWGGEVALPRITRPLLVVCQSTVSDETAEATTLTAADTSHNRIININGVNGLNGVNGNNVSISIHGDANSNGRHPPELENAPLLETSSPDPGDTDSNGRHPLLDDDDAEVEPAVGTASPPSDAAPPDPGDVPALTANGGYTHTTSSRAKISAANKGKVPWNKGQTRSAEVKARISAGVRRRNREKFLAELAAEGITEEEHVRRKKAARREKDAERRRRRTAKGGYTPTDETRQKISRILKEKYASGEVTRTPRHPSKVRRGFKHSEETRQKISESLRRKWAEDEEYRELMTNKTAVATGSVGSSVRQRISETLKKRWEEPEFRARMLEKFAAGRKGGGGGSRDASHRKKISESMKKKWMDEAYRKKVTVGMSKGRESGEGKRAIRAAKPLQSKRSTKRQRRGSAAADGDAAAPGLQLVTPLSPMEAKSKTMTKTKTKRKKRTATKRKSDSDDTRGDITPVEAVPPPPPSAAKPSGGGDGAPEETAPPRGAAHSADGSISRLREERRDLYDLLYGDEEDDELGRAATVDAPPPAGRGRPARGDAPMSLGVRHGVAAASSVAALLAEDDNLDDYDPYGLH